MTAATKFLFDTDFSGKAEGKPAEPVITLAEHAIKLAEAEMAAHRRGYVDAQNDAKVEAIAEALRTSGAEVGEIEKMGKRRLAYEIDDMREGYYVVMKFNSDAAQAKELKRQLGLNEDVMRELLINLDLD